METEAKVIAIEQEAKTAPAVKVEPVEELVSGKFRIVKTLDGRYIRLNYDENGNVNHAMDLSGKNKIQQHSPDGKVNGVQEMVDGVREMVDEQIASLRLERKINQLEQTIKHMAETIQSLVALQD